MNLISNRQAGWRKSALAVMLFAAFGSTALAGSGQVQGEAPASGQAVPGTPSAKDPWIAKWLSVTADRTPMAVKAGVDYGLDPNTGTFIFPKATPESHDGQKFPGQLDHWDRTMLTKNVEVIAFYEGVGSPFHAWNNVLDYEGKRYLYIHDRDYLRIMDVTDPAHAKVVYSKGAVWSEKGPSEDYDPRTVKNYWGGMTIAWNKKLNKPVLVASYEIGRYGLMEDKLKEPQRVAEQRNYNSLKGFKVYAMNGPLPKDWELLATRTTDVAHPDAPVGKQQGSGSLDSPEYFGGKYMILASAPDDSYALTEYSNYLYSPGYQVWDMSNPADPKFVKQITVPGQKADDPASVFEYLKNPRAGNRTSWMGARMPIFLPKPLEKGGKFGFGAMGGLGLWSFDLSDPANPRILDNVNTPPVVLRDRVRQCGRQPVRTDRLCADQRLSLEHGLQRALQGHLGRERQGSGAHEGRGQAAPAGAARGRSVHQLLPAWGLLRSQAFQLHRAAGGLAPEYRALFLLQRRGAAVRRDRPGQAQDRRLLRAADGR